MDTEAKVAKLIVNVSRPEHFDPTIVLDMLEEYNDKWRTIWEELPTDQIFDSLYGANAKYEAFIYQGVLFERRAMDPAEFSWERHEVASVYDGSNAVVEWLLDHAPFECCVPIADLYRYAQGFIVEDNPWNMFLVFTGYRGNPEEGFTALGSNDAVPFGRAITMWGEYADVVDGYISLLRHYSG